MSDVKLQPNLANDQKAYQELLSKRATGGSHIAFNDLPLTEIDKTNEQRGVRTRGSFHREGKRSDSEIANEVQALVLANAKKLHALGNSVRSGSSEAKDIFTLLAMVDENKWAVGDNLERWLAKAKDYCGKAESFRATFHNPEYIDSYGIPLEPFVQSRRISADDARKVQATPLMLNFVNAVVSEARKINPDLAGSLQECAGPVRRALGHSDVAVTNGGKTLQGGAARKYANWFANGRYADNFLEVEGVPQGSREELEAFLNDMPPGAIAIYLDGNRPNWYGHIQVAMGNGKFVSDFVHGPLVYRNPKNVRVFLPVGGR